MATPKAQKTYLQQIESLLANAKTKPVLYKAIVNAPFSEPLNALDIDLGVVVLLLVNNDRLTIDRVALSDTDSAKGAVRMSAKPFSDIKIPITHPKNTIAQAIESGQPQSTNNWKYLFTPALTTQEARFNQAGAGIECSCVYPLKIKDGGALIFSFYQPLEQIGTKHHDFMKAYTKIVSNKLAQS